MLRRLDGPNGRGWPFVALLKKQTNEANRMSESMRTVIVTGGSGGIGRATAERLARDFCMVVPVARSIDGVASTAARIREAGAAALPIDQDMREAVAAERVVEAVLAATGRIDAVVNVAGAVSQTDLFQMTDEEWADGLSLKFHGARKLTLAAWPALKASRGSVIFMSGTAAVTPKASLCAVSSINAAIVALAKAFSERGVCDGVQVNSVLPGPVMTERRRKMLSHYATTKGLDLDAASKAFQQETGITRYGEPADVAELIAFLVSPQSRWLTGVAVRIDGGEIKAA